MAHVVGSSPELPKDIGPCTPFIIAALHEARKERGFSETDSKHYPEFNNETLIAIILENQERESIERFEFFARIAVEGTIEWKGESVHVVLGTPLYVAYAE